MLKIIRICGLHGAQKNYSHFLYIIRFVKTVKYLGVYLDSSLADENDINRQVRSLYCTANKLKQNFIRCSSSVKNILFRSYCMTFYASQVWCNYRPSSLKRLRVAYNDSFRILHCLPRYTSAREQQVLYNITIFDALLRKYMYSFVSRCFQSKKQMDFFINVLRLFFPVKIFSSLSEFFVQFLIHRLLYISLTFVCTIVDSLI